MPSDWSRAGVDWSNLSGQPIDRVVYELWSAVIERDYYYRAMSCETTSQVQAEYNTYIENKKSKSMASQIRDIYAAFSRWLKPGADFDGVSVSMIGYSVFIDDIDGGLADPPTFLGDSDSVYSTLYGKGNLDYTATGSLSIAMGVDLSFIPLFQSYDRPNVEHLKTFYDILQRDLKNRGFYVFWDNGGFGRPSGFRVEKIRSNLIWKPSRGLKSSGAETDKNAVINAYNADSYEYDVFGSIFESYDQAQLSSGNYSISSETNVLYFGLNSIYIPQVDVDTIDIYDYQYIQDTPNNDFDFDYTPASPQNKIVSNNFLIVDLDDPVNPVFNKKVFRSLLVADEIIVNDLTPGNDTSTRRRIGSQIFCNIAKENFLKYYTEPPTP